MRDDRSHDSIDDVIDVAARSMSDAAAPESLRVIVRDRIDKASVGVGLTRHTRPTRPLTGRLAWAGVAVVVLAVAVLIRDEARPPANRGSVPDRAPALAPSEVDGRPQVQTQPPQTVQQRPVRASVEVRTSLPNVPVLIEDIVVPEDAVAIEPVQIEPLWPSPLDVELMETLMPLRAEWVEIQPIVIE